MILGDQIDCCLRADLRHARDIVRRVSLQRLDLNEFCRCYMQRFPNIARVIILDCRLSLFRLRNTDLNMFVRNLQKVTVAGDQRDFHAKRLRLFRERPENIIRLKPRLLDNPDSHGFQNFLDERDLTAQLLRHRMSRTFVLRVHLMTESRRMHIESDGQIVRFLLIKDFEHDIKKAVDCASVHARGICKVRHSVERSVQNTVSVNQDKFFTHKHLLPQASRFTEKACSA